MEKISVIIPTYNRKELLARALRSVYSQEGSTPVEVIVTDDGSTDGTAEALRREFEKELSEKRLRIEEFENCGDCGMGRNRGVPFATGSYFAFLDSDDWWRPGRLLALEPMLGRYDLILESCRELPEQSGDRDWVALFLGMNWGIVSSSVMSREHYFAIGGFPEGYYKKPLREKIPGWEDYETWLRSLLYMSREGKLDRFAVMKERYVVYEPQAGGLGAVKLRRQMMREAMTLLRVAPQVPPRYWPLLSKRLAGAGKAMIFT